MTTSFLSRFEFKCKKKDVRSSDTTIVDKAHQSKERVNKIVNDLKEQWWGERQRLACLPNDDDGTLNWREFLLRERFDPNADTCLSEATQSIGLLEDKSTKAKLQHFLHVYRDLKKQEEEMCSLDREAVLLNLKTDLESLETDNLDVDEKECSALMSEDISDNHSIELLGLSNIDDVIGGNEPGSTGINTLRSSLEGLGETHKQVKSAKLKMDCLKECVDIFKRKTETKRQELFAVSRKLSRELIEIKQKLRLQRQKGNTPELDKVVHEVKRKLENARATLESWRMQEVIVTSIVEHRSITLERYNISENDTWFCGKANFAKENCEQRLLRFRTRQPLQQKEYLDGVRNIRTAMKRLNSDMIDRAAQSQLTIRVNMASLERTLQMFDIVDDKIKAATNKFQRDLGVMHRVKIPMDDRTFLSRLNRILQHIDTGRHVSENDCRLIRFIATSDTFNCKNNVEEVEENIHEEATEPQDPDLEIAARAKELGTVAKDFVASAKKAFLALGASKKLDVLVGTSYSKLDVIKFNIVHRKTYVEAISQALRPIGRNGNVLKLSKKERGSRSKRGVTSKVATCYNNPKPKKLFIPPNNTYPVIAQARKSSSERESLSLPALLGGFKRIQPERTSTPMKLNKTKSPRYKHKVSFKAPPVQNENNLRLTKTPGIPDVQIDAKESQVVRMSHVQRPRKELLDLRRRALHSH